MIPRRARIIRPTSLDGQVLPVEELLQYPGFVLLGDPGMGKTTTFDALHAREGGQKMKARAFSIYGAQAAVGGTLFIDALDEKRPRTASGETTEQLIQRLLSTQPARLRISCRTINWLGITDEEDFQPLFAPLGDFALARLERLNAAEATALLHEEGVNDAGAFLSEAHRRGIERLVESPQTLKMLIRTVQQRGSWPESRRELFSAAATDLLTEVNPTQQTHSDGTFSAEELRPVAGALSASMLIADVERVTLPGAAADEESPLLRSIPLNPTLLEACVSRPLFEADENRGVKPPHRSVQEFLAAEWLASRVRAGLSLRRVLALISVDGAPSSELRGLHGWLATLMPEHAAELLANDPYGFVTHGAPESLTPSLRSALFHSLAQLAATHPGFRRGDWPNPKLAMLSSAELVEEFRPILADEDAPYDLLMTVLDALQFGQPQQDLAAELLTTLARPEQPFSAQQSALLALLQLKGTGRQVAIDFLCGPARGRYDTIRLRVQAAELLFGTELHTDDLISIVRDYVNRPRDNMVGMLWDMRDLADRVSPAVLDAFASDDLGNPNRRSHDTSEPHRMLLGWIWGVLQRHHDIPAEQLWTWLRSAARFRDEYDRGANDELKAHLASLPNLGRELLRVALRESDDEHLARMWRDFVVATLGAYSVDAFLQEVLALLPEPELSDQKRGRLYNMALRSSFGSAYFDPLYEAADGSSVLEPIRQSACYWLIEDWRTENQERNEQQRQGRQQRRAQRHAEFDANRDAVVAGRRADLLGRIAHRHYFHTPPQRFDEPRPIVDRIGQVAAEYGDERAELARQGLIALTSVAEWPGVEVVLNDYENDTVLLWWLAAIAGMDERWEENNSIDGVSLPGLVTLCAIACCFRLYIRDGESQRWSSGWLARAFEEHTVEMRAALLSCINNEIGDAMPTTAVGVEELAKIPSLASQRSQIALELLRSPVPGIFNLRRLSQMAAADSTTHRELADLIEAKLADSGMSEETRDHWFGLAFWVAFERFRVRLADYYQARPAALWTVREAFPHVESDRRSLWSDSSLGQLEFAVQQFARNHAPADDPDESEGDRNAWDATRLVNDLLGVLATHVGRPTAAVFTRLVGDPELVLYRQTIAHYAGEQRALTRQQDYVRPSWADTVAGLFSSAPANVADLHALTIDVLLDVQRRMRTANTDTYRAFWNEGVRGVTVGPKIEDRCRDRLVDLMRPPLVLCEAMADPEGHMVADNRCDVLVSHARAGRVVVEVKRDQHPDVWTACADQLDRLYTRDPEAKGYGVYIVIWHGRQLSAGARPPPSGIAAPTSAIEMEAALTALIPEGDRHRIRALVIDVTPIQDERV